MHAFTVLSLVSACGCIYMLELVPPCFCACMRMHSQVSLHMINDECNLFLPGKVA